MLLAALLGTPAAAADTPSDYLYVTRAGDTLIGIGRRLLREPRDWTQVQKLNRLADPYRMPTGSTLRIPVALLQSEAVSARVVAVSGAARSGDAKVEPGTTLGESAELHTESDGYVTIQLADGSLLTLQPRSRLRLEALKRYRNTEAHDSRIDLGSGRVETQAPKREGRPARLQFRTPAAVVGVRGTQFRVGADESGVARAEVTQGVVAAAKPEQPGAVAAVSEGYGLVVARDRPLGPPVALLPAPDLAGTPDLQERVVVRFSFPAVAGAAGYRAQVAADREFRQVLGESVTSGAEARFTNLEDGAYWLRARGVDAAGLEGHDAVKAFRLKARPEPPFASQPANRGKVRGDSARFAWSAALEAASYVFQLARDARFEQVVAVADGMRETHAVSREKLLPGTYFWRVASVRADGDRGPFGDIQTFELKPAPANPDPPTLDEETLRFTWPAEPGQSFEFQLARDDRFTDALTSRKLDTPEITVPRPEAGAYYMRVKATDPDGFVGPYTATQRVDVPTPPVPRWLLLFLLAPLL